MDSRQLHVSAHSRILALPLAAVLLAASLAGAWADAAAPDVTPPPESFFQVVDEDDRQAAREFYAKHASANGLPVVAAEEVDDAALLRTCEIVTHMLAGRPDVLERMIDDGMYLIIIGKDQVYTDMPEHRRVRNKEYMNERVRGTGGRPTSFGEENLLSLALDRYDDESIAVHEFSHTIDRTLRSLDPDWRNRLRSAYRSARAKGLYERAYASSNPGEYWAEIVQAYFDCNRVNNWNHGPVGTREVLRTYDPEGYELVRSTFRLTPENDWRYEFLHKHPIVIAPPAKFKLDPYYTKFSWAREFPVLGRQASDEALLKANDTIRKMFAYRHDVLKALISNGVKLVVLGDGETLASLPEWEALEAAGCDPEATSADYSPDTGVVVVSADRVTEDLDESEHMGDPVIDAMTEAFHQVTAGRPVDPDWDRRRGVQQYELHVQRLDVRFDQKLQAVFDEAKTAGKWLGTPAAGDKVAYLKAGVLAYFDAGGNALAPENAAQPVTTREALQQYDPGLYDLVHETMAYEGRVDWRLRDADGRGES